MFKYLLFIFLSVQALGQISPFTEVEKTIVLSGDTSKMLRITQTTNADDLKILTSVSDDVEVDEILLKLLAKRMYLSVTDKNSAGVGIAAPQVGINRNLIWVQRFDKAGEPFEFYINPKITWKSNLLQEGMEGCLSIPNQRDQVIRSYAIQLNYSTLSGENITETIEGFTAVIFQHEIDHLFGILFPERVTDQKTRQFNKTEEKGKKLLYNKDLKVSRI